MTNSGERLRWWQYVGPWPLRAWVAFWGVGAVNLIAGLSLQRDEVIKHPLSVLRTAIPVGVGAAAVALLLLLVGRFLSDRTPRHLVTYLLSILCATTLGAFVTIALNHVFGLVDAGALRYLVPQALRMSAWLLFLLAIAGNTVRRLSRQTEIAEQALAVSLEQQSLMLVNEERSRRQIATLLHDRVQAGLMTACLELRMAIAPDAGVDRARIESIIGRIDDLRGMDVRQAARTLSPDLANVDLRTALLELSRIYEPGMSTSIELSPEITGAQPPLSAEALLACYRIAEQGLLNAVVHGGASACTLRLSLNSSGELVIELTDNGRGVQGGAAGFGSAIIDSWCRVLGGTWELADRDGAGSLLSARLPLVTAESRVAGAGDRLRLL